MRLTIFYSNPKIMTSHTLLLNENDRTVALVIAYTPLHNGAEILAALTPERQSEIVRRLAGFQPEDMPMWSERIKNGIDFAGGLLERLDPAVWQRILDDISQNSPELARCVRQRMWLFEDIAKLPDQDISAILKNVESSQWALALKGASEELISKIYKNISKRAAKMLQEEIKYLGPQRSSDVEQVQREIVDIMRSLEDAGDVCRPESDAFSPADSDETGKKILFRKETMKGETKP